MTDHMASGHMDDPSAGWKADASSNRVHCALCGRFHDAPACKFGEPPADAITNSAAKRLAFLWGITEDEAQRRLDADATRKDIPNHVASEAGRVDGSVKSDPDHRAGRLAIREDAGPAGHATRNRVPGILDKIAEMEEWLADWREGQFSPSYDKHGWPIEMHGLAMDVEWLITVVKADRRER